MRRLWRLAFLILVTTAVTPSVAAAAPTLPVWSDTHIGHVGSTDPVKVNYGRGDYVFDTVEFSGSALFGTSILSVGELERLATDDSLELGYKGTYSLLTSGAVFGKSTFSGVKLYDLLVYLGLDTSAPSSTPVRIYAADGYCVTLTVAKVEEAARYNCYVAKGDQTVEQAAVPVLLSFAADLMPLVGPTGDDPMSRIFSVDEGYDPSADNCGGPVRLTIGQTSADDFNARFNAKWVTRVVVGDATTATHVGDYASLGASALTVHVYDSADADVPLKTVTLTVGDIERLPAGTTKQGYYEDGTVAFYRGVDLWQCLGPVLDLPAYRGTVTFGSRSSDPVTVDLAYLRNMSGDYSTYTVTKRATLLDGSPAMLAITDAHPLLAFAKNGYPLVRDGGDAGYLATGVAGAVVDNAGGPLAVLLPADGDRLPDPICARDVTDIMVAVDIPTDLHSGEVYGCLAARVIAFAGDGLDNGRTLTVAELEKEFQLMVAGDYGPMPAICVSPEPGTDASLVPSGTYNGIELLGLLRSPSLGLVVDAGAVCVTGSTGESVSFSVDDLERADVPVLLAFSHNGRPLVEGSASPGYDAEADNSGGPIMLVSEGRCVPDVVSVSVGRKPGLWTHVPLPYSAYLQRALTVSGSQATGTVILSLAQLEARPHVRDSFAASKGRDAYQGVVLRELVTDHLATGVLRPSRITVYGADGYRVDLDVDAVYDGIDSTYQPGEHRDVILAYAKNGYPLVTSSSSEGYVASAYNDDGPLRLIIENSISSWAKDVRAVVLGEGGPVFARDRVAATAVRITSPTPRQTGAYVALGSRLRLRAVLSPVTTTDAVTWTSSGKRRAGISADGVVTARKYGTVVITGRATSGKIDTFTLRVTRPKAATGVTLRRTKTLRVGQTARLAAAVLPSDSTSLLRWRSSDGTVASVDRTGRVMAKKRGVAMITVRTSSGKRAMCKATVIP